AWAAVPGVRSAPTTRRGAVPGGAGPARSGRDGQPRERRWAVGYFNGDATDNELREAVWTGPDRIRMTTSGGVVHEVTVASGGRPDRIVSAGW
ncbi:hypothetical protein, partial [Streptomyces sp. NPDC046685]|uniref:hypothetical protein n=1 Tax=Streptomyces sp. NPDC046685 TaxID=3157202 RepID=UPI003408BD08